MSGPPRSPGPSGAAGPARSSVPRRCRSPSGWPCAACTRCRSRPARRSSWPASRISRWARSAQQIGETEARAEKLLEAGLAQLRTTLNLPDDQVMVRLRELETTARAAAQPVPEDLRASGDRRRRLFLAAGCVAAVALTLVAGAFVRVQPTTQETLPPPSARRCSARCCSAPTGSGRWAARCGGRSRRPRTTPRAAGSTPSARVPGSPTRGAAHLRPLLPVRRQPDPQGQPDDRAVPHRPGRRARLRDGGQVVRWLSAGTGAAALVVRRATAG